MKRKNYSISFSDESFWKKIAKLPEAAGCTLLRSAFYLYFLLLSSEIPLWARASIVAVLGYFVCPIDVLPDFLPGGIGYTDDLAVMVKLLDQLDHFANDNIRKKVNDLLPERCRK